MMKQHVGLISVYLDLGAGRRGVDMGPSAIRIAGLVEKLEQLGLTVSEMGAIHAREPEDIAVENQKCRYITEVAEVNRAIQTQVERALKIADFPLILGGDHSLAIGSVSSIANYYRQRQERIGVIWVDAHTDMNTPETTPSGNIHGMPVSVLLGYGDTRLTQLNGNSPSLHPENVTIIGARDVDPEEKDLIRELNVRVITMSEIDERGISACIDEAIARASEGTAGFHLSFDLDSIDPWEAPGVGTPVEGGLTYREAHLICEKIARSNKMLSMEMVELNPVLDAQNRTAELAVSLIESALGKTIL